MSTCPYCGTSIPSDAFFCPNCGKELRERPISIGVGSQIGIYLLSIFLPPLGLWPGIKYARRHEKKAKVVGATAITLTVISTAVSLWLSWSFLQIYLNTIRSAMNGTGGLY